MNESIDDLNLRIEDWIIYNNGRICLRFKMNFYMND
jgi:hypothetical protein